jgi:hypothetical protein
MDTEELLLFGLCRSIDGEVRVAINGRPIHRGDGEHGLCKLYVYVEREQGGSRAISIRPHITLSHCHPVKNMFFPAAVQVSEDAFQKFIVEVDACEWATFYLIPQPAMEIDDPETV